MAAQGAAGFDPAAVWIGRDNPVPPSPFGAQAAAPLLRRGFTLPADVKRAELRIAGFGYCEAHVNGRPVSDAVLDPPPSQYDKTVFSRTIDVTDLLGKGPNAVTAILGRAYVSGIAGPGAPWTSEPRLLAQLDILLDDGQTRQIVTDDSWEMADSPIHDWMYYGERYDAREEIPGWDLASFDGSTWRAAPVQAPPTAGVVPARTPPVKIVDTFGAVAATTPLPEVTVYDFGKITAGWTRISVRGHAGTRVQLSYGQQLTDGGTVALLEPRTHVDTYTLSGRGTEVWEPRFTRHGFQYVQVAVSEGPLEDFEIEARECHTAVTSTGSFSSSDALLNSIHDNHRRSLLLNHWGFPTDTSWRDRQGWTADTALFLDSAVLNFAGLGELYADWLRSLRDAQQADGSAAIYAPNSYEFPVNNDPSWSGMLIMIPWTLYQYYGDQTFLTDNYEAMAAWMDLMDAAITATADLYTGYSFGDHSSPGSEAGGTLALSPPEGADITKNAHLFQEARTLAKIALLLGDDAAGKKYDAMADRILAAFNAAYFDAGADEYRTPAQAGYRQTSNLVPLALGMVPEGHEDAVFANLVADLESRGYRLNTGALGTKLLLPVLTERGRGDVAYKVAIQTDYPSWGYWVTQGATASWETWRNEGLEQSLDHPFLGTVDDWFYQHLAGIQPAEPGYGAVRVAPVFPAELTHVSATVATPHGDVTSSWQRSDGVLILALSLPGGVETEIVLPLPQDRIKILTGPAVLGSATDSRTVYLTHSTEVIIQID